MKLTLVLISTLILTVSSQVHAEPQYSDEKVASFAEAFVAAQSYIQEKESELESLEQMEEAKARAKVQTLNDEVETLISQQEGISLDEYTEITEQIQTGQAPELAERVNKAIQANMQ